MPASTQKKIDWLGLAQVALVLAVCSGLYIAYCNRRTTNQSWHEVQQWLWQNRLHNIESHFSKKGITSMHKLLDMNAQTISDFPADYQVAIAESVRTYTDSTCLRLWLTYHGLEHYMKSLNHEGIMSLHQLAIMPEEKIQRVMRSDYTLQDYAYLKSQLNELHSYIPTYHQLKDYKASNVFLKHMWAFGGFMLFSILVGLLILVVNMNYIGYSTSRTSRSHTAKSLMEFMTGTYLAPHKCSVKWKWDEPQAVGKTLSFEIKFRQRNGNPYVIMESDKVLVEIMHGSIKVIPTVQLGLKKADAATITFTVHRAGTYKIAIMIKAKHIAGSPFTKRFMSGCIDPGKSILVNQSSIVVCTREVKHLLKVEPRDEYGNQCYTADCTPYEITVVEKSSEYSFKPVLQKSLQRESKQVLIELRMPREGCYQATATYAGSRLKNADFTILVLTDNESAIVNKTVAKKSHGVYYEARLLSETSEKARKVFCYISPKQLTIKEFYLKIIPKRLFTFRVCPSTKFTFLGLNDLYEVPVLQIDDGTQPALKLACKERNVIAATFTNYLLKNIGGSETFKDKQDFFYQELRSFHNKRPHDKVKLKITRANLLETSIKAVKGFTTSEWCKNFEIEFQGEEGLDWGGLRREWFEVICRELFDFNGCGLFCSFKDDAQSLVLPNVSRPAHLKMKHYEFAGKVVGKCIYESALGGTYKQMVKARFARSFLAQLIGLRVNYRYFEQDDPELFTTKIKYIEENPVEGMDLVFAEEVYCSGKLHQVVDIIPNGSHIEVNEENKLFYLDALAQHKLSSRIKEEIEFFLKGLNTLVPDNLLSIFDENELELLICGTGSYSISDFKENYVVYTSSRAFSKVIEWFWSIVAGFTQEEIARLLQFITGCSQLPPGGFGELNPKIHITHSPTFGSLPTAHTCFNQLCLPDYDSMEQMHEALLLAINEGNVGFGMV